MLMYNIHVLYSVQCVQQMYQLNVLIVLETEFFNSTGNKLQNSEKFRGIPLNMEFRKNKSNFEHISVIKRGPIDKTSDADPDPVFLGHPDPDLDQESDSRIRGSGSGSE